MKKKRIYCLWLLPAALVVMLVVACGPATPTPADLAEEAAAEAEVPSGAEAELPVEEAEELPQTDAEPQEPAAAEPVVLDGAVTTESGLQFLEITPGEGPAPQDGDLITMHFSGTLPDGTLFGDTYSTGEPVTVVYGADQLFPGWEEGLSMMKEGGSAKMILPPELAFGEEGFGVIPPNSEVVLDVELLAVEPAPIPVAVDEGDLETTDSGLQYFDIVEGDGAVPEEGSTVSTDFTLWVDGEEGPQFIASSENQGPLTFVVGAGDTVFPGWNEAVSSMKVGGERFVVVPPELGLGAQGGGNIPPDATLLMEIALVDAIEPARMTEVDEADYVTTDSGLQYYDIVEGDGPMPEEGQVVVVHYTGWLEDGTKFDSSLDRGQPFTFPIGTGSVIAGWDEGVATMKVGGKRQLRVPADLAYGEAGSGAIPPGATLIFDVELLDVPQS